MSFRSALAFGFLFVLISSIHAQSGFSADTGECGGDPSRDVSVWKTPVLGNKTGSVKVYGKLEFRHNAEDAKNGRCHVVYRLLVAEDGKPFREVKNVELDTEPGELAGIDLVGFSPSESKFAADFWLAEGDGQLFRPVVYDIQTHAVSDRPLEDAIQKQINGCDQLEHFMGVTDRGEAIFAVPPSEYDDSPGCGDKGLWHFNLQTGRAYRVKKISGYKWK
jgi:hypothetical protein